MIRGTIILSTFFGTAGGLVYDAIYETGKTGKTGVTKAVYEEIYKGMNTIFCDVYKIPNTILSDIYQNSPSKETIGNFISTSAQAAWTAGKAVVGDIYQNSPPKEAIGNFISTPAEAVWGGILEVVSKTYEGVKMPYIDMYGGAKYGLYDIFGEQSNLNGLGTGAITAGILSICGAPTTPRLLISFGAATFAKSVTKYYTDRTSSLSNKDLVSSFNTFFNQFDDNNKSILEEYKDKVFSFNEKNKAAFQKNKEILAKKYLEEIGEYVNKFNPEEVSDFCLNLNKVSFFAILHYTRKADTLNEDDEMLESSNNKEHSGYKFYKKYYKGDNIEKIFADICAMRKDLQEYKSANDVSEDRYKEICSSEQYSGELLCSDFVKDVMFPELVDA